MADLVGHHEADQLAHQVVGHRQLLRPLVAGRGLHEVPVADELDHVVEHPDVRLEDLAGPRVVDVRAEGVRDRGRQPANRRVARVLGVPVGVFLLGRRELADDRVLEAGGLERRLPALDAGGDSGPVLFGDGVVEVEHNRFFRFGERGG